MTRISISPKHIAVLFLYSLLFFPAYYFLYGAIKSPIISLLSLMLVSLIAWFKGAPSGIILCAFNVSWIQLTLTLHANEISTPPQGEAVIGVAVHILAAFTAGYIGALTRKLHLEIEERKRVEALLQEHRNQLEQRVLERTQELENVTSKLHQAEKMETLGQLAGGIAHDFKNHLTIILGFGNLLARKLPPDSQEADFVRQMLSSSERASELTSSLMNFARKERYKPQPLNINDVVEQTVALFAKSFSSKIAVHCSTSPNLPTVLGGKSQIQNAILNLALNSKDAIPENGHITIETKMINVTDRYLSEYCINCQPGSFIGISVSDTGTGIAPDVLPHIFEPFYTTKPEGKGTGMGLATIQGITRQHNGDVFAISEPGKGATFIMLFPAMSAEEAA